MQKLVLDVDTLHVESFPIAVDTEQAPAAYETLRACPTQPWTCTYTG